MNLLIADFLFVDAHKDMNINFINAVGLFAQVDVLSLNGFYDERREEFDKLDIRILDISLERKYGSLESRLFSLNLMKRTSAYIKRKSYDAILCLGFETTLFRFGFSHFYKKQLFLFHHKNIDELANRVKRTFFGFYKNRVYHVVFEAFFMDRLVKDIGVSVDRVFVIPHPTKPIAGMHTDKSYDCVGLCNSNDESFIEDAINHEKDFEKNGLHILLRSKEKEKDSGVINVVKGFMEKEVYDELITAGRTVFVPLPETYFYRLSGSIYDALSREKIVYTTSKYYVEEYGRRYPGTCQYVGSVEQLIERLNRNQDVGIRQSFRKFLNEHSIETVSREIEKMVTTILNSKRR